MERRMTHYNELLLFFVFISGLAVALSLRFSDLRNRRAIASLREENINLSVKVTSLQAVNIKLGERLAQATGHVIAYSVLEDEIKTLQERLGDVEKKYGESVRELEFWRSKDAVNGAAERYYDLVVKNKEDIAKFGSVIAWVEHLKSTIEELKKSVKEGKNGN